LPVGNHIKYLRTQKWGKKHDFRKNTIVDLYKKKGRSAPVQRRQPASLDALRATSSMTAKDSAVSFEHQPSDPAGARCVQKADISSQMVSIQVDPHVLHVVWSARLNHRR
jgi:hypothetical protein